MPRRPLILNAFDMNAISHLSHGLWRHPRDRSRETLRLPYWTRLAQTLERGRFDALFLADVTGTYDVFGGSPDAAVSHAVQLPVNEPTLLVPAMAAVTRHLGFGVTVNIGAEAPALFARRMSTLDHLTDGRIGWNIVNGFMDSAARAIGLGQQEPHDERYDRADEFMDIVYRLWERSWDDDAVFRGPAGVTDAAPAYEASDAFGQATTGPGGDATSRAYADPAKVRPIRHEGRHYRIDAVHLAQPSPQRTPVLFQAGASPRGVAFAASHAECIFIPNQGLAAGAALVRRLRDAVASAGRDPASVRIIGSLQVMTAATRSQAEERYDEYAQYADPTAGLVQFCGATGLDLSGHALDDPIDAPASGTTHGIQSSVASIAKPGQPPLTVRRLLAQMPLGARHAPVVGTPAQVADEMQAWADDAGLDGFNIVRTVTPEGIESFVDLVVPELQRRGLHKREYADGTLRDKLFAAGARLGPAHPAGRLHPPSRPG